MMETSKQKIKDRFIVVSLILIGLVFLWVSIEDGIAVKFVITFGLLGYVMWFIWNTEKARAKSKNNKHMVLLKQIQVDINKIYLQYKDNLSAQEKKDVEEFLYQQGEYELAVMNLLSAIKSKKIKIDEPTKSQLQNVFVSMEIPESRYVDLI